MNYLVKLLLLTLFAISGSAYANVTINKVDLQKFGDKGKVQIQYTGLMNEYPELRVSGRTVIIDIPNSKVNSNMNKAFTFASSKSKDTKVEAAQISKSNSRVKTILPYSLEKMKDKVSLMIKDKKIELVIPYQKVKNTPAKAVAVSNKKTSAKKAQKKEYLNEKYLADLIKEDKTVTLKPKSEQVDTVKTKAAKSQAVQKTGNSTISFMEYGGKFVAFLGVVLLLFYGVITLMKKGFIKKGKLGFLNKTDQVQVLSQTYIAPKKSLMMIKAHDQVFLVSNTDAGIHPISEMSNPAGILKAGEKSVAGMNFDDNVNVANEDNKLEQRVSLKQDITKSNKESSLSSYLGVKDQVKFSDQIKKKVKGLKPLQ